MEILITASHSRQENIDQNLLYFLFTPYTKIYYCLCFW